MTKKNKEAKKGFWAFLPLHSAGSQKEKGTVGLPKATLVIATVRGNHHLKGSKAEPVYIYINKKYTFHCFSSERRLPKTFSFTHMAGLPAS